jgi:hypothetical protein
MKSIQMRKLIAISISVFLAGCATNSTMVNFAIDKQEIVQRIEKSPHVTQLSRVNYAKRTEPSDIQVFHYVFDMMNRPDRIQDWQYHYVTGQGSDPEWKFARLAEVEIYLPDRLDDRAIPQFRQIASSMGGDAVVNVHRKPLRSEKFPAPIDAYLYYGVVVRRKN